MTYKTKYITNGSRVNGSESEKLRETETAKYVTVHTLIENLTGNSTVGH